MEPIVCVQKEETNAFKSLGTGNRIATVLYYVSIALCLGINIVACFSSRNNLQSTLDINYYSIL